MSACCMCKRRYQCVAPVYVSLCVCEKKREKEGRGEGGKGTRRIVFLMLGAGGLWFNYTSGGVKATSRGDGVKGRGEGGCWSRI